MDSAADNRFPRVAAALLLGVLAWLAIVRTGNLSGDSDIGFRFITTYSAVAATCFIAWRFHGIVAATVVLILLRIWEPEFPVHAAFLQRHGDALLLGTLALGIAAGIRQGRNGRTQWGVIAVVASCLAIAWFALDATPTEDPVARDRVRHVTLAMVALAFLAGLCARSATWLDRLRLLGATVGVPAVALLAGQLARGEPATRILDGGAWSDAVGEWRAAIASDRWSAGVWAWPAPLVVASLMVLGLFRTVVRGWKELRQGRPPTAWLLTVASLGVFIAVGARPLASGSLALAAAGALLAVFGIADMILALVERIELRPPEPGPSNVPRVI
jgi:hypothetical protein